MDEWPIPIAQLRDELTDSSQDGHYLNTIPLDFLLENGVRVTAWMDVKQQRFLCGEIDGELLETGRYDKFRYDTLKELVNLTVPFINAQTRRERDALDAT
ncbi:hypothetical protein [Deinococcus alpinitundrae]|uniref:hypothetical protein n=1 Tax=Deinococcus alpinitundrae TaxID=468913 RepID=UPI00137A8986|nr:hypothetical protein [Deinococcus alpinitundrae]